MTPARSAICAAIASRQLLAFDYDGHHRVVEPHCHGRGVDGQDFVRAYQVGGTSASGSLGWKLFDTARMRSLRSIDDQVFTRRPDYRPDDSSMHPVHCSL